MIRFLFAEWLRFLESASENVEKNLSSFYKIFIEPLIKDILSHENTHPNYLTPEQKNELESIVSSGGKKLVDVYISKLKRHDFSPFADRNYSILDTVKLAEFYKRMGLTKENYAFPTFKTFSDYLADSHFFGRKSITTKAVFNTSIYDLLFNTVFSVAHNMVSNLKKKLLTGGGTGAESEGGMDQFTDKVSGGRDDPEAANKINFIDEITVHCLRKIYDRKKEDLEPVIISTFDKISNEYDMSVFENLGKLKFLVYSYLLSKFVAGTYSTSDSKEVYFANDAFFRRFFANGITSRIGSSIVNSLQFREFIDEQIQNDAIGKYLKDITILLFLVKEVNFMLNYGKNRIATSEIVSKIYNHMPDDFKSKYSIELLQKIATDAKDKTIDQEKPDPESTMHLLNKEKKYLSSDLEKLNSDAVEFSKHIDEFAKNIDYPKPMTKREPAILLFSPLTEILSAEQFLSKQITRKFLDRGVSPQDIKSDEICQELEKHFEREGFFEIPESLRS